jgi:competence protein ComEC
MMTDPERRPKVLVAPLVPLTLAVVAGIITDRYVEPWGTGTWGGLTLLAAVIAFVSLKCAPVSIPMLTVAFAALGGGRHHLHWSDLSPDDLAWSASETPQPVWVRGVLRDVIGFRPGPVPENAGTTRAVLALSAVNDGGRWRRASGMVLMVVSGDRSELTAGQPIEAAGTLATVSGPLNPGEFDYRAYLRGQGIRLRLSVDTPSGVWRDTTGSDRWPWRWLGALRAWSHSQISQANEPNVAPLAAALLLGRREGVDPDVNDAFARTGTTHLLAISGLHLQVLAGALWFAFRSVGLGRRAAFASVALATIVYALLVGLMPSVVRSAAMTVTVCVAGIRDRQVRPANLLALAALVTVLLNPSDLFDVGCQLSFLAIAAILWGVEPTSRYLVIGYHMLTFRHQGPGSPLDALERRLEPWWLAQMRRWPPIVSSGLVVSTVVWLAALPLVALRFHLVSPIGILLNVPLVPLTSLALMATGLALGLSAIWAPLGAPFAWIGSVCLAWTEGMVRWGSAQTWGHRFVAGPSWSWVLGVYVLLALATTSGVGRWRHRRLWRTLLACWIALGAVRAALPRHPGRLEAEVLAVGHGLAVVVESPDGRTILYDCGRMHDPHVGRRIIAPAVWERGISRLDTVILSHADSDHYNGLPDLLDRFSIGEVRVAPGFAGDANPGARQLLNLVKLRGVPIRPISEGDRWEWGGVRYSVWHPPAAAQAFASDNARSVVVDVESAGRHFVLTGDLEADGLSRLQERPSRPLDVFLAPHHGGRSANPAWLYTWAEPRLVVVSQRPPAQGANDALAFLPAEGIPVARTWARGAIRVRWGPRSLDVRGFVDDPAGN